MSTQTVSSSGNDMLADLIEEWSAELSRMVDWWMDHGVDRENGGFYGEICNSHQPQQDAPKTIVAQARMCWFFSALAQHSGDDRYRDLALMSRDFLIDNFIDPDNGGVFWETDFKGTPINKRKQAYGNAFAVYALASHYRLTKDVKSRDTAYDIFYVMERHFRDYEENGYWEALAEDWTEIDDVRLSEKDAPFPKSMNTHLHVLEAYSELFHVAPSQEVGEALSNLIDLHIDRITRPNGLHLKLFWDADWTDQSTEVSFGHDIEASWLIWEAATRLGETERMDRARPIVLSLAQAVSDEGVGANGELYNERSLSQDHLDQTRIWWVQAEAMVGHLNAYQISGDMTQLARVNALWRFIQEHIIEKDGGEWRWYSKIDDVQPPYCAGAWKTAYHNGRALMECISRARELNQA